MKVSWFFPEFRKKAISFTFDDGYYQGQDEKMLALLRQHGMKATFNLCPDRLEGVENEEHMRRYAGFEITNHTKYHPYPLAKYLQEKHKPYVGKDADSEDIPLYQRGESYAFLAEPEGYVACIRTGHEELCRIFGEDAVCGFVWPGPGWKPYEELKAYAESRYRMIRSINSKPFLEDETFCVPANWQSWQYNANHTNILKRAQDFCALEISEEDRLAWFCAGVHARDYFLKENNESYHSEEQLNKALELLGGKEEIVWYAGNREVCDYMTALKELCVTEGIVTNQSKVTLYIAIDGKRVILKSGEQYDL